MIDTDNPTQPNPKQTAAEAEAQEFGDWRWGRPAPHYTASRSSSGGSQSSSGSFGTSYGSSSSSSGGMGGASFLSRAVSSAFGGSNSNNNNSSSLLGKASTIKPAHAMVGCVVPDGGDAEAASLDQLLPQAVAHYVNRRMRYDVFLQFRDMLV